MLDKDSHLLEYNLNPVEIDYMILNPINAICLPYKIRTCDLRIRSALLYPAELKEEKKKQASYKIISLFNYYA